MQVFPCAILPAWFIYKHTKRFRKVQTAAWHVFQTNVPLRPQSTILLEKVRIRAFRTIRKSGSLSRRKNSQKPRPNRSPASGHWAEHGGIRPQKRPERPYQPPHERSRTARRSRESKWCGAANERNRAAEGIKARYRRHGMWNMWGYAKYYRYWKASSIPSWRKAAYWICYYT